MARFKLPRDPRWLQIAFLSSFLVTGVLFLGFDIPWWQPPILLGCAWSTQWLMTQVLKVPPAGYLSPTITGLGLSILLRTDALWVLPLAAFAAIAGKFVIRIRGKHLFNPANLGLGVAMLCTSHAWCSPSQWSENTVLIAWFAVLGCAVTQRAFRQDISLAFLAAWVALKVGRVLYLGQHLPALVHQLAVGSLIIFAFFMISDPKTTPDHRAGRIFYAALVASVGFAIQFGLWWQNGLIWALLACSPLVPLIDSLWSPQRKVVPCMPSLVSVSVSSPR